MKASGFLASRCAELEIEPGEVRKRLLDEEGRGVSRQRAYQWFNGDSCPDPEMLPAMCRVLRLDAHGAADLYAACGIPLPETLRPSDTDAAAAS